MHNDLYYVFVNLTGIDIIGSLTTQNNAIYLYIIFTIIKLIYAINIK